MRRQGATSFRGAAQLDDRRSRSPPVGLSISPAVNRMGPAARIPRWAGAREEGPIADDLARGRPWAAITDQSGPMRPSDDIRGGTNGVGRPSGLHQRPERAWREEAGLGKVENFDRRGGCGPAGWADYEEVLLAAKRATPGYREDGPRLAFEFDEVPDGGQGDGERGGEEGGEGEEGGRNSDVAPPMPAPLSNGFAAVPGGALARSGYGFSFPGDQYRGLGPAKPVFPRHPASAFGFEHPYRHPGPFGGLGAPGMPPGDCGRLCGLPHKVRGGPSGPAGRRAGDAMREASRRRREEERLRSQREREVRREEAQRVRAEKAEEKRRLADERRRERDLRRALTSRSTRSRAGDLPDDLDVEMEKLMLGRGPAAGPDGERADHGTSIELPEFPPRSALTEAFPQLGPSLGAGVLMVWGFIHSFSDILGLWPCTMDELAEALVDGQNSRLLGEVHIGLVRLLMAEMEEAHTSGSAQGASSNGGDRLSSCHLLEEAWAWGFDVDVWRAHLSAVTWPEILRQFMVAAGVGPRRPKSKRKARLKTGLEGEDVAQDSDGNLKLQMPTRFSSGSVKAAAWTVLVEAGPEGLPVQEIARRIQKQGLRDLSTSKTPEASVVGALSRDLVFCRVAPATYAVQLDWEGRHGGQSDESAEERALLDQAGNCGKVDAFCSSSDAAKYETHAGGGAATGMGCGEASQEGEKRSPLESGCVSCTEAHNKNANTSRAEPDAALRAPDDSKDASEPGKCEHVQDTDDGCANERARAGAIAVGAGDIGVATKAPHNTTHRHAAAFPDPADDDEQDELEYAVDEDMEEAGAPWVTNLMVSEYQALAIPERLDALIALCDMAVEGPSVRGCLDKRMEEQQRVCRQLLDEMKADRRRRKANSEKSCSRDDAQEKRNDDFATEAKSPRGESSRPAPQQGTAAGSAQAAQTVAKPPSLGGNPPELKCDEAPSCSAAAADAAVEHTRSQQRAETLRRVERANAIRLEPLGLDRRHNRYYHLAAAGAEECSPRIFVEDYQTGSLRVISTPEQLESLIAVLEPRGAREGALHSAILGIKEHLKSQRDGACKRPIGNETTKSGTERAKRRRTEQEQRQWVSSAAPIAAEATHAESNNACYDVKNYLQEPPGEEGALAQGELDPLRLWNLKRGMLLVESAIPEFAFRDAGSWIRREWTGRVRRSTALPELRQCLGELEAALSHSCMAEAFTLAPVILKGAWLNVPNDSVSAGNGEQSERTQSQQTAGELLSHLPSTSSSLFLRLFALDAAIMYKPGGQPARETLPAYNFIQRPTPPSMADLETGQKNYLSPMARKGSSASLEPVGSGDGLNNLGLGCLAEADDQAASECGAERKWEACVEYVDVFTDGSDPLAMVDDDKDKDFNCR
eukprot:evm.model.scf_591.1 EVM.evm.TU.scf_591.1   scf_591:13568-18861(-)